MNNGFSPLSKEHFAAIIVAASNSSERARRGADYVCVGTNDDIQIQAAVDAVSSYGGGIVRILPGTYNLRKAINIKSNISFMMDKKTILKVMPQVSSPLTQDYYADSPVVYVEDASIFRVGMDIALTESNDWGEVCYIEGINTTDNSLTIRRHPWGSNQGSPGIGRNVFMSSGQGGKVYSHYGCINLWHPENVIIDGGELDGNKANTPYQFPNGDSCNSGISSQMTTNLTVRNVYAHDFNCQGIHPWDDHGDMLIENCVCDSCGYGGIVVDSVYGRTVKHISRIINCSGNYNGHSGCKIVCSADVMVSKFSAHHNVMGGFEIYGDGGSNIIVSDILCYNNGPHGIQIGNAANVILSNAYLRDHATGVYLHDSTYCILNGIIIDTATTGISRATYSNVTIDNALYINCTTEIL